MNSFPGTWFHPATALVVLTAAGPVAATAQSATLDRDDGWDPQAVLSAEHYVTPPDAITEAVLAPRHLTRTLSDLSADRAWFLNTIGDGPVTMDRFSRPFHELGGLFVDFAANRERSLSVRSDVGIVVTSAEDGSTVEVDVPDGARVSNATWSPVGGRLAFFAHFDDATHIYVAEAESGRSRRITETPVLATLWTDFDWSADGTHIGTVLVPEDRGAMPVAPPVPAGPRVKRTEDAENRLRTYASLMATPHDQALLRWHVTGQAALIDVATGDVERLGDPVMVRALDPSADAEHVIVERMVEPFSYLVPVRNFGSVTEVWDREGNVRALLDEEELDTGVRDDDDDGPPGAGASDDGRREIAWRADGAGLTFLEREEREDAAGDGPGRDVARGDGPGGGTDQGGRRGPPDRVMLWAPPFDDADLTVVYEHERRIASHRFSPDYALLFLTERNSGDIHEFAIDLDDPEAAHTLARYEADDFYGRPGTLLPATGEVPPDGNPRFFRRFGAGQGNGARVDVSADGRFAYYVGTSYAMDPMRLGPVSYMDRIEIRTGAKTRIFEGTNVGLSERLAAVLDPESGLVVVRRESPTDVPQSYRSADGRLTALTDNRDYTPDLTAAPVERFVVERPDGFRFRVTVNLPPDYERGTRLPALFWFYPREYEDQESYDEGARTFDKNAFPAFRTRSMEFMVRLGYAVVEPDAPIVGPEGRMNNNYEHDLRNNLAAVIDELDARGLIDRRRLAIGGHSYGAFSTANAMVHTPYFRAGIAGDGNYNRTFTPLSFQSERRFLWDAKDVYLGMSPFLFANNLTGALLLYHGMHDQNVGTAPDHTPRLFHALNGLGKEAAMYMYPFEDHGPATRESLLDLWARWSAWLDVHLAEAPRENTVSDGPDQGG